MSINFEVSVPLKEVNAQYLPCNIDHNGEVNIDKYFTPYVSEETKEGKKVLEGSLRGYPLTGTKLAVPEGYSGIIVKEVRSGADTESERTFKAYGQFKEVTYWNLDRQPSQADRYQQAMSWINISKAIHDKDDS